LVGLQQRASRLDPHKNVIKEIASNAIVTTWLTP